MSSIPNAMGCPKCGGTCHGPMYRSVSDPWLSVTATGNITDWLDYRCGRCGYVQSIRPLDRREPTAEAK